MSEIKKTMLSVDGNTAAALGSYNYIEVAGIYPITPSSPMAEVIDVEASKGRKNYFGSVVKVSENTDAASLRYETDEITLLKDDVFTEEVYLSFRGEKVDAQFDLSIKEGSDSNVISYEYLYDSYRLSITALNAGNTILVLSSEAYDTVVVHEFAITVI